MLTHSGQPLFRSPFRIPPARSTKPLPPKDQSAEFWEAQQRDSFRPQWRRAALAGLSLFGSAFGVASFAPTAMAASPTVVELEAVTSQDLKDAIQESFGRAPRSRREAFELVDSLGLKGILGEQNTDGRSVTELLQDFTTRPLARGVHRRKTMLTLLRQLDNPELMKQGERGACAAAGLQHLLASRDPAQYVSLVSDLASPEGVATLNNGQTISRVEDSISDDSGRDEVSRLLQSAFLEYGNGPESYSNRQDLSTGAHDPALHQANPWVVDSGHQEGGHSGLYPNEITRVLKGLFPHNESRTVFVDPSKTDTHYDTLQDIVSRGDIALVGLRWDEGAHLLVVKEVHDDYVLAWNPWGEAREREREQTVDPFFHRGMMPMMAPAGEDGPERETLSETGLLKMDRRIFQNHLLVYEASVGP